MPKNLLFSFFLTLLLVAGGYGVFSIFHSNTAPYQTNSSVLAESTPPELSERPEQSSIVIAPQSTHRNETDFDLDNQIENLLSDAKYRLAVDTVNDEYRSLSSEQLRSLTNIFIGAANKLSRSGQSDQAIELLTFYTNSFNNLQAWTFLSDIYISKKQWLLAIDSLLKATALEYRPDDLERLMGNLTAAASHVRSLLEGQKDELAINDLYRKLYQHHPESARFQLELALSYSRLQDSDNARGLFEPLQYDAEYGAIARMALASMDDYLASKEEPTNTQEPTNRQGEIVVPLLRSGNSFFVNAVINNRQVRLLLDTGASITALSESTIASLKLKSSGQFIRLNTANGMRRSELFSANNVTLGGLSLDSLAVAAIEFEHNSGIDGLLGTDLLNQIDNRYSYLIDNQRNALIFIAK